MMVAGGFSVLVILLAVLMILKVVPVSELIVGVMFILVALGGVAPLIIERRG